MHSGRKQGIKGYLFFMICMFVLSVKCVTADGSDIVVREPGVAYRYAEGTLYIDKGLESVMTDYREGEKRPWEEDEIGTVYHIVINEEVDAIGNNAFANFKNLQDVTFLGNTVKKIGRRAFYGCKSLTAIRLPASVSDIGAYAFYDCGSLRMADLADTNVSELKIYTFGNCYSLEDLRLPGAISKIGDYCFEKCNRIKQINFPETLQYIGICSFAECDKLDNLNLKNSKQKLEIDMYAFYKDKKLTNVTLSSGVNAIRSYAFAQCPDLREVQILSDSITLDGNIFDQVNSITFYAKQNNLDVKNYVSQSNGKLSYVEIYDFSTQHAQITTTEKQYPYTGKEITPQIVVKTATGKVVDSKYYTVIYKNNKNVGQAVITVTGKGAYIGSVQQSFPIIKAKQTLTVKCGNKAAKSKYRLVYGKDKSLALSAATTGNETIRYISSDTSVAKIKDGRVIPKKSGNVKITIVANNITGSNYETAKQVINIQIRKIQDIKYKIVKGVYNTDQKKADTYLSDMNEKGITLKTTVKGKIKPVYKSSDTKVLKVSKSGKVKFVGVGKAKIIISTKETKDYLAAKKTITITVRPSIDCKFKKGVVSGRIQINTNHITAKSKLYIKLYEKKYGKYVCRKTMKKTIGKKKAYSTILNKPQYSTYKVEVYVMKNKVKSRVAVYPEYFARMN